MDRRLLAPSAAILFALFAVACRKPQSVVQTAKSPVGFGDEWLSMTADQKATYVQGFIYGRRVGAEDICDTGVMMPPGKSQPGDENLTEYGRCLAASGQYSHRDPVTGDNAYISVIDTFYSHPECRTMPYSRLLEHLHDAEYKLGEEFYQYVRSGPPWGAFTIEGVDKCYGAARNSSLHSQ
jgi:hypothetical protein